jgi:hypothetical protein
MNAYAPHILISFCLTLTLLMSFSMAQAQQKPPENSQLPRKSEAPTVTCSEAQTSKACSSFKQLLEADDQDILEIFSLRPSYVCFRSNDDAFLIFTVVEPFESEWKKSDHGVGQIQKYESDAYLYEFRDGVSYMTHYAREYWRRIVPALGPEYHYQATQGTDKGLYINIDDTEISIDYPFKNQNGGTTHYSLTIRRSTGRFTETFAVDTAPFLKHSGTCLIYR